MKCTTKKFLLLPMLLMPFLGANAAPIVWRDLNGIWEYSGEYSGYEYYVSHAPYLSIIGEKVDGGLRFWAEAYTYPEYMNSFVLTTPGTVVSREYMDSQTEFFYNGEYSNLSEEIARADYSVFLDVGESAFFATSYTSTMSGSGNTYYGWMELQLNEEGILEMKNNAYNSEPFGNIVVGGIPEPSNVLLLLAGCAALILKRRCKVLKFSD